MDAGGRAKHGALAEKATTAGMQEVEQRRSSCRGGREFDKRPKGAQNAGFASGPVLGVYLLARFAPAVEQTAALAGFVVGIAVLSLLALGTDLYWPWYAAVGATSTLIAGTTIQFVSQRKGSVVR